MDDCEHADSIRDLYCDLLKRSPYIEEHLRSVGGREALSKFNRIPERLQNLAEECKHRKQQRMRQLRELVASFGVDERFEGNFLGSDAFFESAVSVDPEKKHSRELLRDGYESAKTLFIRDWIARKSKSKEKNLPDAEQATAIGAVHGHIQVIARAGSGKTETIANRAAFLQEHCGVAPDEMLMLAFNNKAAKEIEERLRKVLGHEKTPPSMTFHALAHRLVRPPQGLVTDQGENQSLSREFQNAVDDLMLDDKFKGRVRRLMLAHFKADWDIIIKGGYDLSQEEMLRLRRSLARESVRGEYVKSFGEKAIANFLFEHGIPYLYERNFWWSGHNYRPDFTIQAKNDGQSGIVIEYFGLQGDPDYDDQTARKRRFWRDKPEWVLLEFTPEYLSEDMKAFEARFRSELEDHGIKCERLSEEEIWRLAKQRAIDRFTQAMSGFVGRCRKQWIHPDQLAQKIATHHPISAIERWFLNVACRIYKAYLDRLAATNRNDFDGLMQRAVSCIANGQTNFARAGSEAIDLKALRYIFIDEYQDFSESFYRIVQAIRQINPRAELFCVGDDWQAINRFAGSDLRFFRNFEMYFEPFSKLYISTNYRSTSAIVEVGNQLMHGRGQAAVADTDRQGQVLIADREKFNPTVLEEQRFTRAALTPMLLRLASRALREGKNVLLLNRRKDLFVPDGGRKSIDQYLGIVKNFLPQASRDRIDISTAHGSKGRQADVVIVLDAYERSYPLIHPDWVFSRILGESMEEIEEENRSLFYVALTRAREELIMVTESTRASPFLREILARTQISDVDWINYPPLPSNTRWLVVKVNGSCEVNEQLKAEGHRFRGNTRSWDKGFLKDGFSIALLQNTLWARQASGEQQSRLECCIHDDDDTPVAKYAVVAGQWSCVFDKLIDSGEPKQVT